MKIIIFIIFIIILNMSNPSSYRFLILPFKSNIWFLFNSNNIVLNLIIIITTIMCDARPRRADMARAPRV
jgi:hypothetical protein